MSSSPIPVSRWCLLPLFTLAAVLRLAAADAGPAGPEAPGAPTSPAVEAPAQAEAPRAHVNREPIVGIFQSVQLRAHETAEDVVAVFGNVLVEGRVRENAVSVFGSNVAHAEVGGNLVSVFGDLTLTHDVGDNVVCIFGKVNVGPGVVVGGNLVWIGGPATVDPSAQVRGQEVPIRLPGVGGLGTWVREDLLEGRLYPYNRASTWWLVTAMFVLSLLAAAVFRAPVEAGMGVLARRPMAALVNGILGAIITPPLMFLITITGVGVLVLPFAWLALLLATLIGVIALHRFCGAQLGFGTNPVLALAVGHVLFASVYALPYIGLLAWLGVMMFGFGTALSAWGESRRERKSNGASRRPSKTVAASVSVPASPQAPVAAPATPVVPPADSAGPTTSATSSVPPVSAPSSTDEAAAPTPDSIDAPAAMPSSSEPIAPATPMPPPPTDSGAVASGGAPLPPADTEKPERAGFLPRLAASVLDALVVLVVWGMLHLPFNYLLLLLVYHVAFWAWRATTLGGAVMNLRIERLDGRKVDVAIAVVRALGAVVSIMPVFLGFLWVNWDPEKQSWHDKIAGTVIMRMPRGQPLI